MKKISFLVLSLMMLFGSHSFVYADLGLDTAKEAAGQNGAGYNTDKGSVTLLVISLVRAVLGILGVLMLVLFVYAGWLWMTAGGESKKVGTAKTLIIQALIGSAIVLGAFAITNFVIEGIRSAVV